MVGVGAIATEMWVSARPISPASWNSNSMSSSSTKPSGLLHNSLSFPYSPTFSLRQRSVARTHSSPRATASSSSVGSSEYMEEPVTKVKFQTSLSLPGCSGSLSLLGTGFREKKFAMIGVKVYAAGLYVNEAFLNLLNSWKGRSAPDTQEDSTILNSIFQDPFEKSLQIVLVRDVDGKTFWDALNENISPRLKEPSPVDESALSTIRSTIQGKPLKNGTSVFLTWLDPSKMLVSVSSSGLPSGVDATIESPNVPFAFFDVFFGASPVSPSLKDSVVNGLATFLNSSAREMTMKPLQDLLLAEPELSRLGRRDDMEKSLSLEMEMEMELKWVGSLKRYNG